MRKADVTVTFNNFVGWLQWYIDFLNKIYQSQRVVSKAEEKRELFEALTLKVYSLWEIFVEELMIDSLNRDTSQYARFMDLSLPSHMTRNQCKAMFLGLGYVDFRSIGEIKKIAKNILVDQYNPFKKIPKRKGNLIDEFYAIRNYLSHYSLASRRALFNMYKKNYKLRTFREPGGFLLTWDSRSNQVRLGTYINAMLDAVDSMAKYLGGI